MKSKGMHSMACHNCDCSKCNIEPIAHILDIIYFTLKDLGAPQSIKDYTDLELLEFMESKFRGLYNFAVKRGIPEEEVRNFIREVN
jgi:hypothetical protein